MAGRIDELPDPFANPLDSLPDPFAADYKKPGVVLPAVKRLGGRLVQSTGQALEDLGVESAAGITQRGRNIQERNPAYVQSLAELVDRPAQFVGETLADTGAQVGTSALGAKVGGIAGGLIGGRLGGAPGAKAGAKIGATFGGSAPLALQPYGGMRDEQADQGVDDPGRAVAASVASAAVERLGLEKLAGKLVGGEVAKLAPDAIRAKEAGMSALRGALVEAPTEVIQTGIERLGGYRPLWDENALDEYGLAAIGGVVGGAGIGGGLGALTPREQAAPGSEFSQGPQAGGPPGTTPQQSGPAGALPPPTYTGSPGDPAAEYEAQRVAMENRERAEGLYSERAAEEARRQAAIDALAPQPGPQPPLALPAPELADNGVMAVGPDGVARPQYQGEAEQAAAARQQRSIDMGLTPDVVAAQQRRQSQAQDLATLAQQPNAGPLTKAVGNNIDGTSLGQQAPRLTGPGALEGELLPPERREAPKKQALRDQGLIDPENYQRAMGIPMRPDVARRIAEGLAAKGVDSEVLPHPNKPGMLMVVPKQRREPSVPERDITQEASRVEVDSAEMAQASDGRRSDQPQGGARALPAQPASARGQADAGAAGADTGLRAGEPAGNAEPQPKPSLTNYERATRRAKETPVSLTNPGQQANIARTTPTTQQAEAPAAQESPGDLIGESSPESIASLRALAESSDAARIDGVLENGRDKAGNAMPDWTPAGNGFEARQYVQDGQPVQEVRAPNGAVAQRGLDSNGRPYASLEADGTLDEFLSGAPFAGFQDFFGKKQAGADAAIAGPQAQESTTPAVDDAPTSDIDTQIAKAEIVIETMRNTGRRAEDDPRMVAAKERLRALKQVRDSAANAAAGPATTSATAEDSSTVQPAAVTENTASVTANEGSVTAPDPAADIRRPDGKPFPNKLAAGAARAKAGQKETHDIVPVEGGFVVRAKGQGEPASTPANAPRRGEIGGKLAAGEVVTTATGRQTTPFPKVDASSERKLANSNKRAERWLMENALAEAEARGDNFNARSFRANLDKPQQADKDSAEQYLFGDEQPPVVPSILKPLTPAQEAPQADAQDKAAPTLSVEAVRAALKADKALRDAFRSKDGANDPSPETGFAARFVQGWQDAAAGKPMDTRRISKPSPEMREGGFNPVDSYRSGYLSQRDGSPTRARTLDPVTPPPSGATPAATPANPDSGNAAADERTPRQIEREAYAFVISSADLQAASADRTEFDKSVAEALRAGGYAQFADDAAFLDSAFKKASKLRRDAELEKARDPAVYAAKLSEASATADLAEGEHADFKAGFDHALAGRTKSTITGDTKIAGYEAARKWMKTADGRAFYEGKPASKLKNTGAELRRWFDKAKKDADDASGTWRDVIRGLEKATVRAQAFRPDLEGATPGARRTAEYVRDQLRTFKDYLEDKGLVRKYRGETFDQALERRMEVGDEEMQAERLAGIKKAAADYLSRMQAISEGLSGAKTVDEVADKAVAFFFDDPPKSTYSAAIKLDINDIVGDFTGRRNLALLELGGPRERFKRDESQESSSSRKQPIARPRLDRVTRKDRPDYRQGKDVTPEQVKETFGFADIGFGKYVKTKQDQDHLNYAYDAFRDLADVLGIKPRDISLGGKLHLTIGALGHGRHAAHYSPNHRHPDGGTVPVINVTNTKGDGTVSHEWFHALDYALRGGYFKQNGAISALVESGLKARYDKASIDEAITRFARGSWFYKTRSLSKNDRIGQTRFALERGEYGRAKPTTYKVNADTLGEGYWGNNEELFARAGEAYIYDKMAESQNTYLVTDWVADGTVNEKTHRGRPYPAAAERAHFNALFDALFKDIAFTEEGPRYTYIDEGRKARPDDSEVMKILSAERKDFEAYRDSVLERIPEIVREHKRAKSPASDNRSADDADRLLAEQQRREQQRLELEAAEAAQRPDPVTSDGALSEDELGSMFDEAAAELREQNQEQPNVPPPGERVVVDKPPPGGWTDADKVPKADATAAKLVAEAARQGVKGIDEALTGLTKLFGGNNTLRSFPGGIDPDTYAQAKPHFEAALKAFIDAGKTIKDLFKFLIQNFGEGVKPYAIQFAREKGLGANLAESPKQAENQPQEGADNVPDGQTTARDDRAGDDGEGARAASAADRQQDAGQPDQPAGGSREGVVSGGAVDGAEGRGDGAATASADGADAGSDGPAAGGRRGSRGPSGRVPERKRAGSNFLAPEGSLKREGSWRATAERNLDIVELVKKLEAEGRQATPAEQATLAKFTGWGASEIAQNLFPRNDSWAKPEWKALVERRAKLMSDAERDAAARSTQYAHYTSEEVIRGIWTALDGMGFKGGTLLEPGMGVGLFAAAAPIDTMERSRYTGIEYDPFTAKIAKQLFQRENVIEGDYTKTKLPRDFFDAAIGNPPFGKIVISNDPEYAKQRFVLHDYFFAKTMDRVRPGGLVVFVTSRYTMDKAGSKARKYLADQADLLGAIRLPQTAFKDNAGTEVVTDILFLRKRLTGEAPNGVQWTGAATVDMDAGPLNPTVNEYFVANPDMVLGTPALEGSMYRSKEYTVLPPEGSIDAALKAAIAKLPKGVYTPKNDARAMVRESIERDFNPKTKKEGTLYVNDKGDLMRVESGSGVGLAGQLDKPLSSKDAAWVKDYVGLRDAVKQAQYDQLSDGEWETSLKALNKTYDAFVKKHGNVRAFTKIERTETDEDTGETKSISYYRWKNAKLLFLDVESPVVEMLESITEDDSIEKAAFLKGRTIKKPTRREINSTNDALLVSLDERGGLDIPFVAELAKKDEAAVIKELGNQIYEVPGGSWALADEYLSGDVVTKLEEAEAAAEIDDKYQRNVQALLKVQPRPLAPADITVQIGAGWIPVETYEDFASDVLGAEVSITHIPQTNTWKIVGGMSRGAARQQISDFGTPDRSALEILETALLGKDVKITRKDGDGKSYTDKDATAAVNEKLKAMKETFGRWVWQDAGRGARLAALYNRTFNNLAPRTFDGSHLSLPGLSLKYKLYDHQKRAIWRIVQTGNTYLDHAVGAGKTLEMIVAGMEMRRLGLVSKPMYVVPKHMLKQFASEFLDAYPAANILVADDKNFDKANRGRFVAQAALNDPDAVIVTHPSFTKLSVKDESLQRVSDRFVGDLKMAIDEEGDRFRRKEMEAQLERLERRFAAKAGKEGKDAVVDFEDLGVDFIFVDEAHEFRKLDFISRRGNIKGIDSSGSARALDLFVKIQHLDSLRPGRSAVLASGTPVVNTIAELYSIMRMLDIRSLEKDGLDHFDVWANQFGDVRRELEQNAAGQYEFVERFAQFVNVPELMKRVRNTMDVLTSTQLGALVKRPDLEGGQPDLIINPISDRLDNYLKNELAARIEASRNWKPSPGEPNNKDPLINIISDGRLAAIDMRFVDKALKDDPDSKLNRMLEDIVARHREINKREYTDKETGSKDMVRGGTQIVFSSVGFGAQVAASRGFDVKAEIVKKLTAGGIKRDQIAFMDEHSTDAKKAQLFKDMRSGKVRVLFGSPKNMGTGVNVQKRLSFLHYLSPPWYPADVEQPHGRILRQGNQNPMVGIKWYATKGTYDSTMWQMVSRKQKFIEQAFTGDDSVRKLEDVSESSQYEMASALSSGDQRAIQLAGLNADIERLTRLQNAHADEQATFRGRKRSEAFMLKQARERLKQVQDANDAMGGEYVSDMTVNIDGQALKEGVAAGEAIRAAMTKVLNDWKPAADSASEANKNAPSVEIARIQGKYPLMVDAEMISTGDGAVKTGNLTLVLPNNIEQEIEQNNRNPENLDPRGLYTRVRNRLNSLPSMLADQKSRVAEIESNIEKVTARIGVPFQFEADLFDKVKEAADLRAALAGETDAKKAESEAAPDLRADDGRRVADGFSAEQAREIIRRRFGKGAENLERAGILKLISSPADYPPKYAAYLNKMAASRNIKGFYDPESGSAFVIPGNIKSEDDLVKTVLHEIGEHYGLKTMMGDGAYARLLKQLSAMKATNPRVREAFEKVGRLYQHLEPGSERFLREVLASASEDPSILSQPWYKQLIQAIRRFLFKTGIVPIRFTDAELAGMVAASLRQSMRLPPGGPRGGRREPTMERRGEDGIDFRLDDPAGTINRISAAAQKLPSASDFNADKRSVWLRALTRQQIVDVGKDQFNTGSGNLAQQFERVARQIEADSNNELNKPIGEGRRTFGEIAEAWAKMASPNPVGGNRSGAAQLARVMHEATLIGIDPDKPMQNEADPAEYARLRKAFTALPADVQTLYRDVRDAYAKRREDFEQALTQRIEESKASGSQKRAMLNSLRQQFEAGRVKGPYFPLSRFGDYYVVAEKDGEREFVMAESQAEQRRELERLRAEGFTVRAGKSIKGLASEMGKGNSTFIADMVNMIDAEVSGPEADALKDGLWQMYLQSLPELSVRKKFIHRKGTPGFSQDALRAFASQIGHGSKQIARLRHAHKLSDALRAMKEHAANAPDPNKAADILKALDSSYQWMMTPNNASWANNLTNLGFAWYLGVTPAAAAVNLTQLPIVTLPVLAAKNGWAAASSALGAACARSSFTARARRASRRTRCAPLPARSATARSRLPGCGTPTS